MTVFKFLFQSSNIALRTTAQFAVFLTAGTLGISVAATSASAGLDAVASNTSPNVISSGTLTLQQASAAGSQGFTSTIPPLAPGDTFTFYVDYTNGTLAAQNLYLSITDTTTTNSLLTTDATKGLKINIIQCSQAWVSGACPVGATTTNITPALPTAISTYNTSLIGANNDVQVWTGTTSALEVKRLKFIITLPDQTETIVNGSIPSTSIQGLTANITWKLREIQRPVVLN